MPSLIVSKCLLTRQSTSSCRSAHSPVAAIAPLSAPTWAFTFAMEAASLAKPRGPMDSDGMEEGGEGCGGGGSGGSCAHSMPSSSRMSATGVAEAPPHAVSNETSCKVAGGRKRASALH